MKTGTINPRIALMNAKMKLCRNSLAKIRIIGGSVLSFVVLAFFCGNCLCSGQIQQAWVAHYNNGITDGTNQAVKMALDTSGNIYITGFSQNTNGLLGYATIKYNPNGAQVWAARYDTTNGSSAKPAGLVLDNSNNVIVTGTALTVKYNTSGGNQLWTAPYAGTGLATDTNGNICVVGFSTDFGTVKLSPTGSNLWHVTYPSPNGPNVSQVVAIDGNGNVDVAGSETFGCDRYNCYVDLLLLQYDSNGTQHWTNYYLSGSARSVQVEGFVLDNAANVCLVADFTLQSYLTLKYAVNGGELWAALDPTGDGFSQAFGLAIDHLGSILVTGQNAYDYPKAQYGTYKLDANGTYISTNLFPIPSVGVSVGRSITLDQGNSAYVTGYSPGPSSRNDIVTIKYDSNGNQIWLQRYDGPASGDDEGNAIAVDASGNVYVAGFDTLPGGGTEMVLIKYSPIPVLQKQGNGNVILQAYGSPGQSIDFRASTNLQIWQDLVTNQADTNGNAFYTDTNASNFAHRFYTAKPQ